MLDDETALRRAIDTADIRYDGAFFAAVVTTGIYCRVVCSARPKPENVRLFPTAAAAEAGGFRPCKRCHPERAPDIPVWAGLPPVVSRAMGLIADGALDTGDVEELGRRVGTVPRHLRRLFVEHLGAPPLAIARARRVHLARRLLDETELPLAQVAFAAGFGSVRRFNDDMRRTFGVAPRELRRARRRAATTDGDGITLGLGYRPPLDWARMIAFLQARATAGVEVAEHDRYRRTVVIEGTPGVLELCADAHDTAMTMHLHLPSVPRLGPIVARARRLFGLDADPVAMIEHLRADPVIGRLVRARPGLRVPGAFDPFEVAVRAICGQQISVRAATALAGRIVEAYGKPLDREAGPGLSRTFPTPDVLADAELRDLGMTGAQAGAIGALARAVADDAAVLDIADGLDASVERLCELPGIGAWTAHYIAMRLGEPDAFPASDLGLRRAASPDGEALSARALTEMAEAWRPWRATAAMYLWNRRRT